MNWTQWTIVVSALLRLPGVFALWEASIALSGKRPNYPTAPRFVPPMFKVCGLLLAFDIADLCDRARVVPPHPLLSGYGLTIIVLVLSLSGHYWLQKCWLPTAVRNTIDEKIHRFQKMPFCVRRRKVKEQRARMKRMAASLPHRPGFALELLSENPPVTGDETGIWPTGFERLS